MADQPMQQVLAQVAALRAEVAALKRRRRRPRPLLPAALVALLAALIPLALLAATPFADLTGGVHDANIEAIYNAGVTTGCVPLPDPNPQYCPTASVTREEMASFLARLGGLGANKPVTNAARLALGNPAPGGPTFAANDLARVARTVLPNTIVPSPSPAPIAVTADLPLFQSIGTVTITAPSAGFVLVTAQTLGVTTMSSGLFLRLRDTTSGEVSPLAGQGIGTAAATLTTTMTATHVFPVAAGPRTFVLEATGVGPSDGDLYDTEITALYVPFGYDGGTTLAP